MQHGPGHRGTRAGGRGGTRPAAPARRPASPRWIAAREEVLGLADTQPQVSFEKFESVCRRHGLRTDQAAALAETLHLDGRLVYHGDDDMLSGFVVLNPEWLTQAISFVLEDAPTGAAGGILDHARLRRIWDGATAGPAIRPTTTRTSSG